MTSPIARPREEFALNVVTAPSETPAPQPLPHAAHQSYWLWIMCLTGVDYFSTLGYQPSIAFENAGRLAPLATVVLVLLTLFGALPVYAYVAGQSSQGQGSISMLERLVHGWRGKFLVLVRTKQDPLRLFPKTHFPHGSRGRRTLKKCGFACANLLVEPIRLPNEKPSCIRLSW